ncbi:hypothetical protein [Sanyastnella coralliicola]|uniref:hypothetical protein n=1 Tax=Sanyastnella coralliicola TaxID=3069118 RepID=UPI0027BA09EE|nr:hypothetical protein [Longitalea sp. SCSIO 12813]
MRKILIIALCLVALSACRKEEPESEVHRTPDFEVEGTLNGEAFDMTPGTNGLYMFTESWDNDFGGFESITTITVPDSDGMELSFRFIAGDEEIDNTAAHIEGLGESDVALGFEDEVNTILHLNSEEQEVFWFVNGNAVVDGEDPSVEVDPNFPVEIGYLSDLLCGGSMTCTVFPIAPCSGDVMIGVINAHIDYEAEEFILFPPVTDPDLILLWEVNESFYQTIGMDPLVIPFDPFGFGLEISVSLAITDNGTEFVPFIDQFIELPLDDCQLPWVESEIEREHEPVIQVFFTDEGGNRYSSILECDPLGGQPDESFFTIHTVTPYEANEQGQATLQVDFSTSILLKEESGGPLGEEVLLELQNASIAFAY